MRRVWMVVACALALGGCGDEKSRYEVAVSRGDTTILIDHDTGDTWRLMSSRDDAGAQWVQVRRGQNLVNPPKTSYSLPEAQLHNATSSNQTD